ncbi:MAG TPA: DUF1697 domain-containing protein [Thermoanaerobaculia bacterium]|nr:DUF1697 domain-containing protein [Thermoanaerobaculia bacterium]
MMYAALLRAVNVAGHQPIAMADLRSIAENLGFNEVRTLLQSGNLIFGSARRDDFEKMLEAKLHTDVFVRSTADLDAIVAANPFPTEAKDDPGRLVVLFLKSSADAPALQKAIKGREVARGKGKQLYVYYPDGQGRSKLTNALIEKTLDTRVTARNWNTVLKLRDATQ